MELPKNGWFVRENPIKMDDLRYPHFRKPPYLMGTSMVSGFDFPVNP